MRWQAGAQSAASPSQSFFAERAVVPLRVRLGPADRPAASRALAHLSATEELRPPDDHRVRECGTADCALLFVDRSRPGRRRWCSERACGTKARSAGLPATPREGQRHSGVPVTTRFITMVEVSRCTPGRAASVSSRSLPNSRALSAPHSVQSSCGSGMASWRPYAWASARPAWSPRG
ncbi:MAG: CGNR zinc finger domain-containing protein [Streptosporangiaceae bacterium]